MNDAGWVIHDEARNGQGFIIAACGFDTRLLVRRTTTAIRSSLRTG